MYIFLDVDGVLNTEADWAKKIYSLRPECVQEFLWLLKALPNPKVVLSSSWRNGIARDGFTAVHIKELIDALSPAGIQKLDKTGISPDGLRSKEINHYLRRNPKDSYIIFDDDKALFEEQEKTAYLFLTDPARGLTHKDVSRVIMNVMKVKRK